MTARTSLSSSACYSDLGVSVLPVIAWEICLAAFLILKGFGRRLSPRRITNPKDSDNG